VKWSGDTISSQILTTAFIPDEGPTLMAESERGSPRAEAPVLPAGYPVVVEQAVVGGDMDSYRHVNNTVYFRYFENVRLEYFRRLDWFDFEKETGIGPILAATEARFRKPLTYPDTISIGAHIGSVGE